MNTALVLPTLPSTTETSLIVSNGKGSSLTITADAPEVNRLAFTGEDRNTLKNSSASLSVSPMTATAMNLLVSPGANTSTLLVEI